MWLHRIAMSSLWYTCTPKVPNETANVLPWKALNNVFLQLGSSLYGSLFEVESISSDDNVL